MTPYTMHVSAQLELLDPVAASRDTCSRTRRFWPVAAAFSASDVSRARCEPADHLFQGHAIWHVLGAFTIAAAFRHYRQFNAQFV